MARAGIEQDPNEDQTQEDFARALVVDAYGPRTAAWLVNRHRRQLHLAGAVDFVLKRTILERFTPPGRKLFWFQIAIDMLKQRPGWSVERTEHRGIVKFRLKWLGWLSHAKAARDRA
jgi:hypothetical protein